MQFIVVFSKVRAGIGYVRAFPLETTKNLYSGANSFRIHRALDENH